ncbi:MAG: MFS transporter [Chlamydiae bacterium]|nr:MFS transporter [Chlamydiota bacterium]
MEEHVRPTRRAILLSSILHEPFSVLYPLLPFIFLKDLGASSFQIVLLVMLKPVVALFSFYWSSKVKKRKDLLRTNLLGAGILARVPLLLALFLDNIWLLIIASALYMLFSRAGIPAWMEMLKLNLPSKMREKIFSTGATLGYGVGVVLAIVVGQILDTNISYWKVLYASSLVVGLLAVFIQCAIPINGENHLVEKEKEKLNPWKESFSLMKKRPDFRRFQLGFMAGGFGLMLLQPVMPQFFDEVLHLSYKNLAIAYSVCKGLGFVFTSSVWSAGLTRVSITHLTALVLFGFSLFPLCILFAPISHFWIYVAYILYGIAQAGSHLVWHLSGPIFAKEEDSSTYSGVNIVMVGIRGLIGPPLGGLLACSLGLYFPFFTSIFLCLIGIFLLYFKAPSPIKAEIEA